MTAVITRFDNELLQKARTFLDAADANEGSRQLLAQFGFTQGESARGRKLVANTEASFTWEREGRAWNFLSPTPERRVEEARHWHADTRRRYLRECFRGAEQAKGLAATLREVWRMFSRSASVERKAQLERDLQAARGERPADAPPPKDSALVELAGWYERWRLLAQRVFRERGDLLAPYGLSPGKAPPRLRGKLARLKYGEGAAGGANSSLEVEADEAEPAEPRRALPVIR